MAIALVVAAAGTARAQTPAAPPLLFGATFESYYAWNANRPDDRVLRLHSYDQLSNSFSIQQLALVFESPVDTANNKRYGLRVDLQWGQATAALQGSSANEPRADMYRNLYQAYGTYVFPVGLAVDAGKFASNLGLETNYAKDNNQFSRGYLFTFLPGYHAGIRATAPLGSRASVSYMLTNGTNQTEDFNEFKSHEISVSLRPTSHVGVIASVYSGQEQPDLESGRGPDGALRIYDLQATFSSNRVSFGADVVRVTSRTGGGDAPAALTAAGLMARVQGRSAAASIRYELVNDDGGLFGGWKQQLQEITATAEWRAEDHFQFRFELRRDWSDDFFWPTRDSGSQTQTSVLAGLIWTMGTKTGIW